MIRARSFKYLALCAAFGLSLAACASPAPAPVAQAPSATPPAGPPQRGLAVVAGLQVAAPSAGAAAVQVTVAGELGDACTELADVQTERTGRTFVVTINTARPAGAACAAVVKAFEKQVSLDVSGQPAGDYVVVANGVSGQFTLAGLEPTASPLPPTAAPTEAPTEAPAASPTPAAQPTQAPAPTVAPAAANCLNKAAFDRDVTIPDQTVLTAGQKFVKTWRVQNAGSCVWQGYQLIFDNGDKMGAAALALPMPSVQPGAYVELSVDMVAPAEGGSHIGRWQFQTPAGQRFGLSVPNDGLLWVWIDVPYSGNAAAAAPAASSGGGGGGAGACGSSRNSAGEADLLAQINSIRAQNGLPALNLNAQLNEAAWRHAQDMACNGINSLNPHRGSDGTQFKDRVFQAGYPGSAARSRENVYYGGTPADAMDWWLNSQIHRENILFSTAVDIGIAYAVRPGSEWTNYYTLVFGVP